MALRPIIYNLVQSSFPVCPDPSDVVYMYIWPTEPFKWDVCTHCGGMGLVVKVIVKLKWFLVKTISLIFNSTVVCGSLIIPVSKSSIQAVMSSL